MTVADAYNYHNQPGATGGRHLAPYVVDAYKNGLCMRFTTMSAAIALLCRVCKSRLDFDFLGLHLCALEYVRLPGAKWLTLPPRSAPPPPPPN